MKLNLRDWKTFMGGFSASSTFQGTILQSLDSRPLLSPSSPLSEGKSWGFQGGWRWPPGNLRGSREGAGKALETARQHGLRSGEPSGVLQATQGAPCLPSPKALDLVHSAGKAQRPTDTEFPRGTAKHGHWTPCGCRAVWSPRDEGHRGACGNAAPG